MKVCVFGAGAIGGHVAGRLAKGGAEVSVVARGAHLAAIRANGLRVELPDEVIDCRPAASADPAELGPQDAVVVTVKAPALPSVAAAIAPLLGPDTAVAFVMNGIPWWYFHAHGGALDGRRLPLARSRRRTVERGRPGPGDRRGGLFALHRHGAGRDPCRGQPRTASCSASRTGGARRGPRRWARRCAPAGSKST